MGNILRQWRATNLLADREFKVEERFPFSFEPRKKVRIDDFFRVLRDHYEGTQYDQTNHYRNASPHTTKPNTICNETTQYSFVAQLRDWLPAEINNIAWISFRQPDAHAYCPWFFSINKSPENYYRGNAETALRSHFNPGSWQLGDNHDEAFWNFAKLSELVDRLYRNRIEKVQKVWRNFENFAFKDLKNREKEFSYLLETNKTVAMKIITNYVHNLEYRRWFLAMELLNEFRQ
jgi:dipeptidase